MSKLVFISCGQYTEAEKQLGKQIAHMVRTLTGLEPFFAEEVQDLNGLDANILEALRNCAGFIVVLHPRGKIERPRGLPIVRASVWIEQEIAIATYIARVEKRPLPIIAFKHTSVGLEGIRQLLQLNPIEFSGESKILFELPSRLMEWKSLQPSGISLELKSVSATPQDGHPIKTLELWLVNDTDQPIAAYNGKLRLPEDILKHWSAIYPLEQKPCDQVGMRCFRFSQADYGHANPRDRKRLFTTNYCTKCAVPQGEGEFWGLTMVSQMVIDATTWINGKAYSTKVTIKDLAGGS
jgi:hypothetical protein